MPILALADAEIHYEVFGEGPPMVFLAATAWPGTPWKLHQVSEFSRDHRVIVYDQRGTGASTTRGTDFSTARLAADAAALLEHLGVEGAIVCGHSNGGRVAQMLTVEYPRAVGRLVLLSSGATHGRRGVPLPMILKLVEHGYLEYERATHIATGCTPAYYSAHREQVDAFVEGLLPGRAPLETMLRYVAGAQESDTTARLREIRVPALVMVGDAEKHNVAGTTHFAFAEILASRMNDAKLVVMPDAGHYYAFYTPERTNEVIRAFLATAPEGATR